MQIYFQMCDCATKELKHQKVTSFVTFSLVNAVNWHGKTNLKNSHLAQVKKLQTNCILFKTFVPVEKRQFRIILQWFYEQYQVIFLLE